MKKHSICFLTQFPPPIHGLSKAIETLYDSPLNSKYLFSKIDTKNNKKVFRTILSLLTTKAEIIYFTISQTKGGNLRDLLFLKLIELRKKKCIIHLHGGYYRILIDEDCPKWQRTLNVHAIAKVDACIVLGKSLRYIYEGLIDDKKIYVVPNCVDDKYLATSINDKIEAVKRQETIHILYLSNLIRTKGYREVLQLATLLKKQSYKIHFAGKFYNDEERDFFNKFIAENQLEYIVNYHGVVSGQSKIDLLYRCNLFILPTRYPNEGQPISILEAMGNGMLIITTDHAGISEIASDANGFICDKNNIDVNNIADYIKTICCNREALINISKNNYEQVKLLYTQEQYIANMDNVFDKISNE